MKKFIAILMVLMICFSLVACGKNKKINELNEKVDALEQELENNNASDKIVGTWVFGSSGYNAGTKLTLKADNTFSFARGSESINGNWTFLPEISTALLVAQGEVEFAIFEEVNGVLKVNMQGEYAEKEN